MLAMGQTHCQALNTLYHGSFSAPWSWTSLHTGKLCVLGQFTNVLTLVRQGEEKTSGLMSGLFIPPHNCSSPNSSASGPQSPRTSPRITENSQRAGDRAWRLLSHCLSCDTHSTRNSKGVQELKSASGIDFLFIGVSRVTLQCRDKCVICASPL